MNDIEQIASTERQAAYLRHLAAPVHESGMPDLYIGHFTQAQAAAWIDYLRLVVQAEERVREYSSAHETQRSNPSPLLVTRARVLAHWSPSATSRSWWEWRWSLVGS
jgi:uncharacterized protein YfbU (UPF0304 family)